MTASSPSQDEQIPGTVHLVDLQGTMHAKHAKGGQKDIVLIPTPSNDPDDPLNWTPRRKALSTICMCVYTLMVGIASAAIYSILEPISTSTTLTLSDLNSGTGYMFLFFGWGCLIWQPLALQYGKRPIYLFSILATCAIQVWAPYTKTNGQWIANKILQGFFGAPIESLCEISVTDVWFAHERGRYMGLYGLLLAGSNFFAPIIAGFINDGMGWEWVLYWCAIFCAIGFIFLFFFMEETNFPRHTIIDSEDATATSSTPVTTKSNDADDTEKTPTEKDPETLSPTSITSPEDQEPEIGPPRLLTSSKKTYLQKLSLFQKNDLHKPNHIPDMMLRPLIFLTFPVIFYAGFSYGSNLVWFNVLNGTSSLILANSPYNFSSSMVGLSYISPLLGTTLASYYTGPIGDKFILWYTRHRSPNNSGILEAETRLWLFVPSLVLIPFGLILWGVGASQGIHWFGTVFAMGVIGFTNTVGLGLSVLYAVDSYRALQGEVVVTVILVRNTMSFAVGYGITPWITGMGLQNCFITAAFVGMAQCLTFLLIIKYGKGLRRKSTARYATYVERMSRSGMVH